MRRFASTRAWSLPALAAAVSSWVHPRPSVDPMCTLEVQQALARLDREIVGLLHGDGDEFARAHHLTAAFLAYDYALDDACRLAGIAPLPGERTLRRVLAEAELRSRGWQW